MNYCATILYFRQSSEKYIKNKLLKNNFLAVLLIISTTFVYAQIGGMRSYQFLDIPVAARSTAMGGYLLTNNDSDITVAGDNAATINKSVHDQISFSYVNYIADANIAAVNYGRDFEKYGTFVFGLKYLTYGKFTEADIYGEKLGTFGANDAVFSASYGKKLHSLFTVGATFKAIYSSYYKFNSFG